jgi:tRNA 2-thiouridine synthesizing protein A
MSGNHPDIDLDARGLLCPLPVLKARKRLAAMARGEILRVIATDAMAVIDIPHFCTEQGHALISVEALGTTHVFRIKRG